MARSIEHSRTFSADPAKVRETLTDPEFVAAKVAALGGRRGQVRHCADGEVATTHAVASEKLPAAVRALIGGDLMIERTERWRDDKSAEVHVAIPRSPAELTGEISLDAAGEGCTQRLSGTLRVSVPLVGGRIEESVSGALTKLLDREADFTERWLAEHS